MHCFAQTVRRLMVAAAASMMLTGAAAAVTFKIADQGDALSMDPHSLNESLQLTFTGNVYEPLVARDKQLYKQTFSRSLPTSKLEKLVPVSGRRGTAVTFKADHEIFGNKLKFKPSLLYQMARSKAYLFKGV